MKIRSFSAIALISSVMLAHSAFAADAKTAVIAVVETQKVLEGSSAFKKLREAADNKMKALQQEAEKTEESFKKRFEEIEAKKVSGSKEENEKKIQELNKAFQKAQQDLSSKKQNFDNVQGEAVQKINDTFVKSVSEEAEKVKATVVMQKGALLYVKDDTADITNQVLENLNKKMPSVEVKF